MQTCLAALVALQQMTQCLLHYGAGLLQVLQVPILALLHLQLCAG